MSIIIKRNTGCMGMASKVQIIANEEKLADIDEKETIKEFIIINSTFIFNKKRANKF